MNPQQVTILLLVGAEVLVVLIVAAVALQLGPEDSGKLSILMGFFVPVITTLGGAIGYVLNGDKPKPRRRTNVNGKTKA